MDPALRSGENPLEQLSEGPIFVVGVARSGTTWVFSILRAHPLVHAVNESCLFDSQHGLAELLGNKYWGSGPGRVREQLTREEFASEIGRFAARVLGRRLRPHHRFLVEKTPGHLWMTSVIGEVFPTARFIHVLRDGRDVYVSVRAARRSWAKHWRNRRNSLPFTARRWKLAFRHLRDTRATVGDRLLEVRYEEMRADPFAAYRKIYDFCGIPYDDELLARVHGKTDFGGRHQPNELAFYRGGRVGDWRTHFNLVEGLVFNLIAGDGLIEAGYEPTRWWRPPIRRKVRVPRRAAPTSSAERETPGAAGG